MNPIRGRPPGRKKGEGVEVAEAVCRYNCNSTDLPYAELFCNHNCKSTVYFRLEPYMTVQHVPMIKFFSAPVWSTGSKNIVAQATSVSPLTNPPVRSPAHPHTNPKV